MAGLLLSISVKLPPDDDVPPRVDPEPGTCSYRVKYVRETIVEVSRIELGEVAGFARGYVSMVENGRRFKSPTYETVDRLIIAFRLLGADVDPAWLVWGTGKQPRRNAAYAERVRVATAMEKRAARNLMTKNADLIGRKRRERLSGIDPVHREAVRAADAVSFSNWLETDEPQTGH